jgi:ZIP family zinc transporter
MAQLQPSVLLVFAVLPLLSTAAGGGLVLRLRRRMVPITAFAAGLLVATALADLLPEAGALLGERHSLVVAGAAATGGYVVFLAVESLLDYRGGRHRPAPADDPPAFPREVPAGGRADGAAAHQDGGRGRGGLLALAPPAGLIVHSLFDGLAIGLGFRTSLEVGLVVALAVLAHDFVDGMNVVTLALAGGCGPRAAAAMLALDALAPPCGVALSSVIPLSPAALGLLLAAFAGLFLAIGASDLLPEVRQRPSRARLPPLVFTAAGAGLVVAVRSALG